MAFGTAESVGQSFNWRSPLGAGALAHSIFFVRLFSLFLVIQNEWIGLYTFTCDCEETTSDMLAQGQDMKFGN